MINGAIGSIDQMIGKYETEPQAKKIMNEVQEQVIVFAFFNSDSFHVVELTVPWTIPKWTSQYQRPVARAQIVLLWKFMKR